VRPLWKTTVLLAALALPAGRAHAIINPSLQPIHLYERYDTVLALRIADVDEDQHTAILAVVATIKGTFAPKQVVLSEANEDVGNAFEALMWKDQAVVAFVGKKLRGHEWETLFYPGRGRWQIGRLDPSDPSKWQWTKDIDPSVNEQMFGTFNGSAERLVEMMTDLARDRYYYPAIPFVQFRDDVVVGKFAETIRGVALYDIDGDGDLDIYACSDGGDRVYLQTAALEFTDSTAALGLEGLKSPSVNFADVDADGRADLLAGAVIYLAEGEGAGRKFRVSELLPKSAAERLKCAAFVEINGDGYPDVVVSKVDGGLAVYLNPGAKGGRFVDATAASGLSAPACGADRSGFFAPGDWNADGRTDLFYAVGDGLLLLQDADGRFAPLEHRLRFDFQTGGETLGLTGAGCFAPLWRPETSDLVFSDESGVNFVVNVSAEPREMSGYGNEITEGSFGLLATIAEDLDADGYVDIYAASRSVLPNMFYTNRGYGSFMTPLKYKPTAFPGPAHQRGAWGVAAGDADGNGANDLLLGGADGTLTLILNDSLRDRTPKEHPTIQEKVLARTRILTVRVRGKVGVLGATVTLADKKGTIIGRRVIGSNVATGCRGPDVVNLTVREPGPCVLTVRFADGLVQTWPADLSAKEHTVIEATREAATGANDARAEGAASKPTQDGSVAP